MNKLIKSIALGGALALGATTANAGPHGGGFHSSPHVTYHATPRVYSAPRVYTAPRIYHVAPRRAYVAPQRVVVRQKYYNTWGPYRYSRPWIFPSYGYYTAPRRCRSDEVLVRYTRTYPYRYYCAPRRDYYGW